MPGRSANCGSRKYVAPTTISTISSILRSIRSSSAKCTSLDAGLLLRPARCSSASRPLRCFRADWVAPLRACIWRRGRASATTSRPSTSIASRTGRSGPADDAERRQQLGHIGVEQRRRRRPARRTRSRSSTRRRRRRRTRWPAGGHGGRCGCLRRRATWRNTSRIRSSVTASASSASSDATVDRVVGQQHRVDADPRRRRACAASARRRHGRRATPAPRARPCGAATRTDGRRRRPSVAGSGRGGTSGRPPAPPRRAP